MQIHSQIQSLGSQAHPVLQEKASPPAGQERARIASSVSAGRGKGVVGTEGAATPKLRDTLVEIGKVLRDVLRDRPQATETAHDRVRDRIVDRPLANPTIGTGVETETEVDEPRLRDEPLAAAPGTQESNYEAFLRKAGENILNLLKEFKSRTPEWFTLGRSTPTPAPTGAPLSSTGPVESAAAGEGVPAPVAPGETSTGAGNGGARGQVLREVGETVGSLLGSLGTNVSRPGNVPAETGAARAGLSSSTAVEAQVGAQASAVAGAPQQAPQPPTGLANLSLLQQAGENLVELLKKLQNEFSPSTYGPTPVKSSTVSVHFNFFNVVT